MSPKKCLICGNEMSAEIKDLHKFNEHSVPVWHCSHCNISNRVKKWDRYYWVNSYKWEKDSVFSTDSKSCLGCGRETMEADSLFMLTQDFPFYEKKCQVWTCATCGFSGMVSEKDKYKWADSYKGWV